MLEQCDFMELTEEVLQQCKGFTCKDEDITEFFTDNITQMIPPVALK